MIPKTARQCLLSNFFCQNKIKREKGGREQDKRICGNFATRDSKTYPTAGVLFANNPNALFFVFFVHFKLKPKLGRKEKPGQILSW